MKASVAIVGGGIQGLMLAFCLAERDLRDVLVLDAGYWQGGASGRNGTLVRPGFSSPEWTRLFGHSHRLWLGLSRRLGHNVMVSRRGYVVLAESDRTAAICEQVLRVNGECGVAVRALPSDEFRRRLPAITHAKVKSAIIFDAGGTAPHHAVMKGLLAACLARGVTIRYQTPVTGIERQGDRAVGVRLGEELVGADSVVIAAGAHSPRVALLAGVELEGRPWRLEACAIEPTRAALGPALAMLVRGRWRRSRIDPCLGPSRAGALRPPSGGDDALACRAPDFAPMGGAYPCDIRFRAASGAASGLPGSLGDRRLELRHRGRPGRRRSAGQGHRDRPDRRSHGALRR